MNLSTHQGRFAGTNHLWLELLEVQPEGKARQPAGDWANGARLTAADQLG